VLDTLNHSNPFTMDNCRLDNTDKIENGSYFPLVALTMIGGKALDNIQMALEDVIARNVPGDFIETGVWRGGACVFAKAVLEARGVTDRKVIVADSFDGLPPPDPKYPADAGAGYHETTCLKISQPQVQGAFERFGLLDDRVVFLKGYFSETMKGPFPFESIAVLRMDGDMYSSTIEVLEGLYDKVSVGGYIIIDDYHAMINCKLAVDDFRKARNITEPMIPINWAALYWIKAR
jgi:hypothetical protein